VSDPFYNDGPQNRMEVWKGSELYRNPEGFCRNSEVSNCRADSVVCHYMTPEAMVNYTDILRRTSPDRYKEYAKLM
jgi:hypothetical protein